jgi:iron complex transport system substrate-binding protein
MTLTEVLASIETIGRVTNSQERATELLSSLRRRLELVAASVRGRERPRIAVLEWTDPPFSSGHWVPDMVEAAGAFSALGISGERSMEIEWSDVATAEPDEIVVAPCGYRLDGARQLAEQIQTAGVLPAGVPVWAVNADAAFVRPGPRVIEGVETLAHIAHPDMWDAPAGMLVRVTDRD